MGKVQGKRREGVATVQGMCGEGDAVAVLAACRQSSVGDDRRAARCDQAAPPVWQRGPVAGQGILGRRGCG